MYVLSQETLYCTGVCSEACSRISLGWLSYKNSDVIPESSRLSFAKQVHHKPYNFTLLQNLQEVHTARVQLCIRHREAVYSDTVSPLLLHFPDEIT